jgi:hypothetical protein
VTGVKVALIAVSVLAGLLALALVAVVLTSNTVTVGGFPEFANEGDAPPPREDGPTRRVTTEINDGSGWKDVDLEITLLEARTAKAEFEVRNRADDGVADSPRLVAIDTQGQSHDEGLSSTCLPAERGRATSQSRCPTTPGSNALRSRIIGEPIGWDLDREL